MADGRKNNGGHSTKGKAGRKSIIDELKTRQLILSTLKRIYRKELDDENIELFLKTFIQEPAGQKFIAEHLLGKPKEHVEVTHETDGYILTYKKREEDS